MKASLIRRVLISASLERYPSLLCRIISRSRIATVNAQPGKGHLFLDNNPVERGIRPTALGRENWLFIGRPDAGWRTAV